MFLERLKRHFILKLLLVRFHDLRSHFVRKNYLSILRELGDGIRRRVLTSEHVFALDDTNSPDRNSLRGEVETDFEEGSIKQLDQGCVDYNKIANNPTI